MKLTRLSFSLVLFTCGAFAACGSNAGSGSGGTFTGDNDAGGLVANNGDASTVIITGGGDGSTVILGGGDGASQIGTLTIAPLAPVLTAVTGQPAPKQQFTASLGGQAATGVAWSLDAGQLGTIDANGLFVATGTVGGVGHITASAAGQTVSTTITVNVQMTNGAGDPAYSPTPVDAGAGGYGGVGGNGPGAPPTGTQTTTLGGTPTSDSTVSILYPYDGTVWPQGLLAPLLQWQQGSHNFDSVAVTIQENNFTYKGLFGANATPFVNLPIPAQAWSTMAYSNGGEPVKVSLVFGEGTKAYGPYTETWTIAQATLQGTIYYNSYGTALVQNSDGLDYYNRQYGAGTLAIAPGATAPTLVGGVNSSGTNDAGAPGGNGTGCRVCHTVAPNGQSLVTQTQANPTALDYSTSVTINLSNDTTGGAGTNLATKNLTFPAFYKDGSLLFSSTGGLSYPSSDSETSGTSQLYSMPSGTPVSGVTGLPANLEAALPSFSPDGAHVAFNFYQGSFTVDGGATLSGDTTSLALLDFNGTNAFTNPRVAYTPTTGAVTYSSFFPNAAGIVFEVELSNVSGNWGYTWSQGRTPATATAGNTGELWWLDVASGKAQRLNALNGYGASGSIYLPGPSTPSADDAGAPVHTPALDVTLNYEPTVNPIASGGYVWVVFTSRRMYGNVAQGSPWISDPRYYPWLDEVTDKKLWVAAIDLNAAPGTDPSHPAFYLPAQELHAGNARGYWTVEPCRANGQSCMTGDQCCAGFCESGPDGGLECTMQAPSCSGQYDKCTTTTQCCGASEGIQCINGICTLAAPPTPK